MCIRDSGCTSNSQCYNLRMNPSDKEKQSAKARMREAEEVGCHGLIRGVARSFHDHMDWDADLAHRRDGPFFCTTCYSDAVLHKCVEKIDHFAHKARLTPVIGAHQMILHNACTSEIHRELSQLHPGGKWGIERAIPENAARGTPKLVPDISGRINGQRVAIEVQVSALTIPKIVQRTRDYAKCQIALVWIVPLSEPLGTLPFRPRLYERYLHSIFFGRIYYWWAGQGLTVKPVHYGPAKRHIQHREWYEDGALVTAGGYEATYKTIKTPEYGPDLNISADFIPCKRGTFTPENERKAVPASLIWRDKLPKDAFQLNKAQGS